MKQEQEIENKYLLKEINAFFDKYLSKIDIEFLQENILQINGHLKNSSEDLKLEKLNKDLTKKLKDYFFNLNLIEKNENKILLEVFFTQDKEEYQKNKLMSQYDHRTLGKKLDIFFIDDLVGKGLPIWLPKGVTLKNIIKDFLIEMEKKYNYLHVETPVLGSLNLYKTSGHYQHYKDTMFPELNIDKHESLMLRPMACPHHIMIYKRKLHSYRDLPIRYAEHVKQFRYEPSGGLLGLERVRAMELTDSHIFLREDQLKDEIKNVFNLVLEVLTKFNIKIEFIELALHDSNNVEKYHGDEINWQKSEKILKEFLVENNIKFVEKVGEAAFYGPKIDIQIKTNLGHIITSSTIQLDFFLPERFDMYYIDSNKDRKRPIMIHRGIIGTYERFISILLEQNQGAFPLWLAPIQAVVIPVNNNFHLEYAQKIFNELKNNGIRVILNSENERLSNKIRKYEIEKINYVLIVGDKEKENSTITCREYGKSETKIINFQNWKDLFTK